MTENNVDDDGSGVKPKTEGQKALLFKIPGDIWYQKLRYLQRLYKRYENTSDKFRKKMKGHRFCVS